MTGNSGRWNMTMSICYDFVDFLGVQPFNGKERLQGSIRLAIRTLTPLFIGSGYEDIYENKLYRSFVRSGGNCIIPGSSLKGMARSISEAVSYSCAKVSRELSKDLPFLSGKNCNCISCRTYGRVDLKGRVSFGDCVFTEGRHSIIRIPLQMAPHIEKRGIYYNAGKLRGIKFYRHGDYRIIEKKEIPVEAVEEGSVFKGEIIFDGIDKEQLGLLCYSLGLDRSFTPKIGGNKAGFFGSCIIEAERSRVGGETFDPAEYASGYGNSDKGIKKNKDKLSEILDFENRITAM